MLHPSHLDIIYKRFDKMKYEPNKIRKYYREKLETCGRKCRMKVGKLFIEWDKGLSLIDEILNDTMKVPYAFSEGNVFVVGSFLDDFALYLDEMQKRIHTLNSTEMIHVAHEQIMDKQKEIIEVMINNVKNPIKLDELNNILNGRL